MDLGQILSTTVAVLGMLVIITAIIFVHELGHWSAARFFGFQAPVFGFGLPFFGPYWRLGKFWDTEFRLHALFFGGYVLIPELGDESSAVGEPYGVELKPLRKFPVWQRAIVAFAGVFNNYVFAYLVMLVMLMTLGSPIQDVVVLLLPDSNPIAKEAGVNIGDRILAIDDKKMNSTDDVVSYLEKRKNTRVTLHLWRPDKLDEGLRKALEKRDAEKRAAGNDGNQVDAKSDASSRDAGQSGGQMLREKNPDEGKGNEKIQTGPASAELGPASKRGDVPGRLLEVTCTTNANGKLGMGLADKLSSQFEKLDASSPELVCQAWDRTWSSTCAMVKSLGMMASGVAHSAARFIAGPGSQTKSDGPGVGPGDVHGLLFVMKVGADLAKHDWTMLPMFVILISLDLAIINLVPFPALDGGHLAFMFIEAIRGKPLPKHFQEELVKWGVIGLLALMALITVNDIRALVAGEGDMGVDSDKGSMPAETTPEAGPGSGSSGEGPGVPPAGGRTDTGNRDDLPAGSVEAPADTGRAGDRDSRPPTADDSPTSSEK